MKAMISQPMRGLARDEIEKTRARAAKRLEGLGYEVVDTLFGEHPKTGNSALRCLAASLKMMAECDAVYLCRGWEKCRGCRIEQQAAVDYGLKILDEGSEGSEGEKE